MSLNKFQQRGFFLTDPAQGGSGGGSTAPVASWKDGVSVGNLPSTADWQELSGLTNPFKSENSGYLFGISDGANGFLLAINKATAASGGKLTLTGVTPSDVEDVASASVGGQPYIYVADIGDNANARASFNIYRVKEPTITGSDFTVAGSEIETINCIYDTGTPPTHKDAECLIVDTNGDMYIITKREAVPKVFKLAHAASYTGQQTFVYQGTMTDIPDATSPQATGNVVGGCISPDGKRILIKNYADVFYFPRLTGETILQALQKSLVTEWSYVGGGEFPGTPTGRFYQHPNFEPQGEAITFDYDGRDYYTCSEYQSAWGSGASSFPLFRYEMAAKAATTIAFQDGVAPTGAYAGTTDTYLDATAPTTNRGADAVLISDYNATDIWRDALIKWDISAIPAGATIIGADLVLYISTEGQGWNVHRMLVAWSESDTYNSFNSNAGGPVDAGSEASATVMGATGATAVSLDTFVGFYRHKLKASEVASMLADNKGILIKATDIATGDGQQHDSSEGATATRRPKLVIRYHT